ncbi:MAG: BREX system Lon protease-like protein BrxL, partial [Leptonema sp. (in: bacteria)]
GDKVTRAKMFDDMQKNSPGFITRYDFIAFDEKPLNFLTTKR